MNFNRKLAFDVAWVTLVAILVFLFPSERLFILSLAALFLFVVVLVRTGIKLSMQWVLVFDASCVALFSLVAFLFPDERDQVLGLAGTFLVFLLLHALVVPIKGLKFVIHDASPDSMVKLYGLAIIVPAIFFGDWGGAVIWRYIG